MIDESPCRIQNCSKIRIIVFKENNLLTTMFTLKCSEKKNGESSKYF